MKLELKHVASYLPYGLKCRVKGYDDFEVDGISLATKKISQSDCLDSYDLELTFKVSECKPLLRPLSDLTKEIDGVVHLVELAKIHITSSEWTLSSGKAVMEHGSIAFGYDDGFWAEFAYEIYDVNNQLELYEYLFQHHFDVYGLIEKGLAIDINTIENV